SEQIRATTSWRQYFDAQAALAKLTGEPQWVTDLYNQYVAQVDQALAENRGLTGNLPICNYTFDVPPPVNGKGAIVSYTKPIILLTDNFTLSAAEVFSMFLQDNQRATIVGTPTDGGGGNVVGYDSVTNYSQGYARVTEGIITRLNPVATPGFPAIGYYDGVGIYPDVVEDYMTVDNLMHRGTTFVSDITAVLNGLIAKAK
ncbi:MAG: hypothetical protein JO022_06065, partial [Acidobacteriaceae bacterium]|nr:hypothetical protein [Acidobacteriaceae bacterium]